MEGQLVHYVVIATVAFLCYHNALYCGFVFDDISAIRDNKDLRPSTPISNLLWNDFWGTPIHKEHSHKSYRPLCVLTFRLNYMLHELNPWGFHFVNIILHTVVCLLYYRVCLLFLPLNVGLLAALLFAVHPVHTEAVTGVVGRAEILSSVFFLLAFLSYTRCPSRWKNTDWFQMACCLLFVVLATLSKEQGITVIGICCIYEVFVYQKLKLPDIIQMCRMLATSKGPPPAWQRSMILRLGVLVCSALCLLVARVKIMGAQLPVFTKYDNPAAVSGTPARQLTFNYLLPVNSWLLIFPCDLCCDWTMGTIPLVESILDPRNIATLTLYSALLILTWSALVNDAYHCQIMLMSLSLIVLPFLPASNLFFPVGFVVAERVLYTPSMGFCLLVAYGWYLIEDRINKRHILWMAITIVLVCHGAKTLLRNHDWRSEHELFAAGLKVNHRNAKLYNNVGHALESRGDYKEALKYFLQASIVQPDDIGAHINVGRTYNNLKMFDEAEQAFWKAKNLLPRPRPGEPYQARIAPSHLNVFLNLANLISRNGTRLEEADALYRQAIGMRADYIQAYINRGDILIKLNRTNEAQEVYEKALQFDNSNPDIYYNLGVVYLEQSKVAEALAYFDKALEIDSEHEQALMNSAILIQESGNPNLRQTAYNRLFKLLQKGKVNERVYFNLGMLAMDDKKMVLAENWFKKAIEIKEDFRSALFNLALLLSDAHRPLDAVPFLKQLLKHHPDHVKGLILLGDIYINHVKDLRLAEKCYQRILSLEPNNVQALHNLCVVYVEKGLLQLAETCLVKAASLAPQEEYLQRHLRIVRARIQKQKGGHSVSDSAKGHMPRTSAPYKDVYSESPEKKENIISSDSNKFYSEVSLSELEGSPPQSGVQTDGRQVMQKKHNVTIKR